MGFNALHISLIHISTWLLSNSHGMHGSANTNTHTHTHVCYMHTHQGARSSNQSINTPIFNLKFHRFGERPIRISHKLRASVTNWFLKRCSHINSRKRQKKLDDNLLKLAKNFAKKFWIRGHFFYFHTVQHLKFYACLFVQSERMQHITFFVIFLLKRLQFPLFSSHWTCSSSVLSFLLYMPLWHKIYHICVFLNLLAVSLSISIWVCIAVLLRLLKTIHTLARKKKKKKKNVGNENKTIVLANVSAVSTAAHSITHTHRYVSL